MNDKKDGEKAVYGGQILVRAARDDNIKKIEFVLWHENEIRDALMEAVTGGGHTGGAPSGHARISDKTAQTAIKLAEGVPYIEWYECPRGRQKARCASGCKQYQSCLRGLKNPAQWLTVCSAVVAFCEGDAIRREVFRRRYTPNRGRRSTMISESTYYFVLNEIRAFALSAAAQAQVIRVF